MLEPLLRRVEAHAFAAERLHGDDTTVSVLAKDKTHSARAWVGYANLLACFTLFPLLTRDGLRIPYAVLTLLWAYLLALPPFSLSAYMPSASEGGPHWTSKVLHLGTYAAMLGWHGVVAFKEPPQDKPDLWVVANVLVGAAGFGCCYLWCLWRLVADSGTPSAFERKAREVERKRQ